jgi:hypothetical protein
MMKTIRLKDTVLAILSAFAVAIRFAPVKQFAVALIIAAAMRFVLAKAIHHVRPAEASAVVLAHLFINLRRVYNEL